MICNGYDEGYEIGLDQGYEEGYEEEMIVYYLRPGTMIWRYTTPDGDIIHESDSQLIRTAKSVRYVQQDICEQDTYYVVFWLPDRALPWTRIRVAWTHVDCCDEMTAEVVEESIR
jgi:hypothetical protein